MPRERDANLEAINATWNLSEGVKTLFRQAREAITYYVTTWNRIPENIIVDKVLLVIVNSQAFKQAYVEFKALTN